MGERRCRSGREQGSHGQPPGKVVCWLPPSRLQSFIKGNCPLANLLSVPFVSGTYISHKRRITFGGCTTYGLLQSRSKNQAWVHKRTFKHDHLSIIICGEQLDAGIEKASRENYLGKFLIVDLTVTIHIGLTDHLVNLVVGQLLPCKPCDL